MPRLHPETRKSWKQGLQKRLQHSMNVLRGMTRLTSTHSRHCLAFKRALTTNQRFMKEVQKLTPLEREVLSISSTEDQLYRGMPYFEAEFVSELFLFGIETSQRRKIQESMQNTPQYKDALKTCSSVPLDETARVDDLLSRIKHTLSKQAARELHKKLDKYLDERPISPIDISDGTAPPSRDLDSLGHLDSDSRDLLNIIYAAGAIVPECLFTTACTSSRAGILTAVDVPVAEVLTHQARTDAALNTLLEQRLLLAHDIRGSFVLHPEAVYQLYTEANHQTWKVAALEAVCRAFPRDSALPSSSSRCKALIPALSAVLPYLPRDGLNSQLQRAIVEVCLSASRFGLLPWKQLMLQFAKRYDPDDVELKQRLFARTRALSRLEPQEDQIDIPNSAHGSPLLDEPIAEQALLDMKLLVDQGAPLTDVEWFSARLQPLRNLRSTGAKDVWFRAQVCLARAFRNAGHFGRAATLCDQIWYNEEIAVSKRAITAIYAEVVCEQGDPVKAMNILGADINTNITGTGGRIQIALASAYLSEALLMFNKSRQIHHKSLLEAESLYESYLRSITHRPAGGLTRTIKYNHHLACAGNAMVQHILSLDTALDHRSASLPLWKALTAWEKTLVAARGCWTTPGFAEMIALASASEVAGRLGLDDATKMGTEARRIAEKTGRQYYFVHQGTIWLDILEGQSQQKFVKE